MSITINFKNKKLSKNSANLILFVDEKFNINHLKEHISGSEYSFISDLLKTKDKKKKIINFDLSSKKKIILVSVEKSLSTSQIENLGAKFYDFLKNSKQIEYTLNSDTVLSKSKNVAGFFLHGLRLKSYIFDKYKTKKNKVNLIINVIGKKTFSFNDQIRFKAIEEGTFFTRDLVSEPGNVLHPDEYAKRLNLLKKDGLKINIYDEKKLKKLGMNTLLGVGQGSIRGSYLVTMEWNGLKNNSKPLAFVGKGVCFDTGGISLKPAKFMEDMTYDMAGSAVVVGLMKNFALRKSKINAVGVVGLVENMPGSNAQRPGDIVKSYSGKTVEILNTDAEGRLVLADVLWYIKEKYKPRFMVDLATLTGAIIVALGDRYAGLFSNDDDLANKLLSASKGSEELLWRLPIDEDFDKLLNCQVADMKNITGTRGAGSITAAQFLKRFVGNIPWVHLDIAGVTWSKKGTDFSRPGGTGFGVRLLDNFIKNNYE